MIRSFVRKIVFGITGVNSINVINPVRYFSEVYFRIAYANLGGFVHGGKFKGLFLQKSIKRVKQIEKDGMNWFLKLGCSLFADRWINEHRGTQFNRWVVAQLPSK